MGIRVNKRIGYGVDNILWRKIDKYSYELNDPRFDIEKWKNNKAERWTSEQFINWCDKNVDKIQEAAKLDLIGKNYYKNDEFVMLELNLLKSFIKLKEEDSFVKNLRQKHLYDTFYCNYEGGIKNVFIMEPLSCGNRWHRHDDMIDWEEETTKYDQTNRYEMMGWSGIFPYNVSMIRYKNSYPEELDSIINTHFVEPIKKGRMDASTYSQLVGHWSPKIAPIAKGDVLKDLKENWRCQIPIEIYAQLLAMGFVKDVASFVNELRPILYVYWS